MKQKIKDLPRIINSAKASLAELKTRHPTLRCYLVFSSNYGQCSLKSDLELLEEFPAIAESSPVLDKFCQLRVSLNKASKAKLDEEFRKIQSELKSLEELVKELVIKDEVFIEWRFEQLDYGLIAELKEDKLLKTPYTNPQERSIRIVLSRVNDL